MKIRIVCKNENYEKYKTILEKAGFTISNDANLLFREEDYLQDSFVGEVDGNYEIITYQDVLYFESFGHDIYMHILNNNLRIKEKLFEIEAMLTDKGFIRINKSQIINKFMIKKIVPTFNSRFILIMKNNDELYVSRSYKTLFKQSIGL